MKVLIKELEKLFEDAKEAGLAEPAPELQEIELENLERREFHRIETSDQHLELKFTNAQQFARQYIENISLGGMFVRTELKPVLNAELPIEFSVQAPGGTEKKTFNLHARVRRIAEEGVGLEFIDLDGERRKELESFVCSIKPEGVSLINHVKKASVEHLEQMRDERFLKHIRIIKRRRKLGILAILIGLNLLVGLSIPKAPESHRLYRDRTVQIEHQSVNLRTLQKVERGPDGKIHFIGDEGDISIALEKIDESQLPDDLNHTIRFLKASTAPDTVKKGSKNNKRNLTHLR